MQRRAVGVAPPFGPGAGEAEVLLRRRVVAVGREVSARQWQVDCRAGGGLAGGDRVGGGRTYSVRLDADTGRVLSIARDPSEDAPDDNHRGITGGDSGDTGDTGDIRSRRRTPSGDAPGAPPPVSPDRAEALARRYLRLADIELPPPVAGAARAPAVVRLTGPLSASYAVTLRPVRGARSADRADDPCARPAGVRVNVDARDGSLIGLYRLHRRRPRSHLSAPLKKARFGEASFERQGVSGRRFCTLVSIQENGG